MKKIVAASLIVALALAWEPWSAGSRILAETPVPTGPQIFDPAVQSQRLSAPLSWGAAPAAADAVSPPSEWTQFLANQQHNAVFPLVPGSPAYLASGTFWATPLTGYTFWQLMRAMPRYPTVQAWGAEVSQWMGNVSGVSVSDGIVYVEESQNEIFAVSAATGQPIWRTGTVNSLMGDALAATLDGRPTVFVTAGDVGFTRSHALDYANQGNPPGPTIRGGNFSAVYALNGVTGQVLWRFDTPGEAMPTPVLKNGTLFFTTGDGHLYAVDARTGTQLSAFSTPGFSSMSSPNWYQTADGRLFVIYGAQDPNALVAVDETDPSHPRLAWTYAVPASVSTGIGDVPPVVDPAAGLVITDAVVNNLAAGGTADNPVYNLDVFALNAATGSPAWSRLAGGSASLPVAFKGSVPMVHGGSVYLGDVLNGTYLSYNETTGNLNWQTALPPGGPMPNPPRAGAAFYRGFIIDTSGPDIVTIDPRSGQIVHRFRDPGAFIWGVMSPVIVGNEMYFAALSGWAFALPATYVMTSPGFIRQPYGPQYALPLIPSPGTAYDNPAALPTPAEAARFPALWTAYAGNPAHNAVTATGPSGIQWATPLNHALPLAAPPRDQALFGTTLATQMTGMAFGVGTGVSPANGIVYAGDNRYTINALNAYTGALIWQFRTIAANFGQPLVTPHTVVVSSGDPWFNFTPMTQLAVQDPSTHIGAGFQVLHGLDPLTGRLKWSWYSMGSDMMTPLDYRGALYWVNGHGNVWALNADTGMPLPAFVDAQTNPRLSLGGFAAIASPNLYTAPDGTPVMVTGTEDPAAIWGINLTTDSVLWRQPVSAYPWAPTGFADVSPVVDQADGLIITDGLVNAGAGLTTLTVVAVQGRTGQVVWTRPLATGPMPTGFTGAVPVVDGGVIYVGDPLNQTEVALSAASGAVLWQTPAGAAIEAPGVVDGPFVIAGAGRQLDTFDRVTGALVHVLPVGGAFLDNNPTIVGQTLYIGNAWGWTMAFPVAAVTGGNL